MKQDKFESFVSKNRNEFDQLEPSDQVWERINLQMNETPTKKLRSFPWLRIASVLLLLTTIGSILVYQNRSSNQVQTAQSDQLDPEIQELMEAEAYYAQEVSGKMAKIEKCYQVNPDIKLEIEGDLNELEMMYRSLKNDLKENISNKEVIEAMIENNRNRMKLVDEVLDQINC